MTNAVVASAPAPTQPAFISLLAGFAMADGEYEWWTFIMVFLRILALLLVMLALTLYAHWLLAVGLGLVVVAGVAIDTWHQLLAKSHEQRSRL